LEDPGVFHSHDSEPFWTFRSHRKRTLLPGVPNLGKDIVVMENVKLLTFIITFEIDNESMITYGSVYIPLVLI
jgi:hypothetical protein